MENAPQIIDLSPAGITIALHSKDRPFLQSSLDELDRFGYIYRSEREVPDESSAVLLDFERQHKRQDEGSAQNSRVILVGDVPWEKDPFGGDWHDEIVPGLAPRQDDCCCPRPVIWRLAEIDLPVFLLPAVVPDDPRITFCNVIDAFRSPKRAVTAICEKLGISPVDPFLSVAEALIVQSTWSLGLLVDLAKEGHTTAEALLTIDPTLDRREALLLGAISQGDEESTRQALQSLNRPVSSIRFSGGHTLLHLAACFPNNSKIEAALLDAGADVNARSVMGATPLHCAVWNPPNDQTLLDRGADSRVVSLEGDSALNVAAWLGNPETVARHLEAGALPILTDKNGGHAVSWAAQAGRVEVLQRILSRYPDSIDVCTGAYGMGSQDPEFGTDMPGLPALVRMRRYRAINNPKLGSTALMTAAFGGARDAVQFLLTRGALPNLSNRSGLRALHYAVQATDHALEIVNALVQSGADPDGRDQEGSTALLLATAFGRLDCVSALVKKGANIDAADENGLTALHHAAYLGNTELVTGLLQLKSTPGLFDKSGLTPLQYAVLGYASVDAIRALLSGGSRVDEKTREGRGVLSLIALSKRSEADRLAIADFLLELGADANEAGPNGHSLLFEAALAGDGFFVDALLRRGAAIRQEGSNKVTPLQAAIAGGHDEIVQKLLQAGADPNVADTTGETALHEAVTYKRTRAWEMLLENGGDPWKGDSNNQCAAVAAALLGYEDFCRPVLESINLLRAKSPSNGLALICAAFLGKTELLGRFLTAGTSPDYASEDGWRPLSAASSRGQSGAVELLLEVEAKVNWAVGTRTALCCAIEFGDQAMVHRFLALKADPNAPAGQGRGPLHFAVMQSSEELLKELIDAGSFVDARENGGRTPLHIAAEKNRGEAAKVLLRSHANPTALDGNGDSPLHLAIASGALDVVRVLLEEDDNLHNLVDTLGQRPIERADAASLDAVLAIFREKSRDPGLQSTSRRQTQRTTELARFLDWRPATSAECNALANSSDLPDGVDEAANDILTADLGFLDQASVLAVGDPSRREPPNQRFYLWSRRLGTIHAMKWTNEAIYNANETYGFRITEHTSLEIVRQYTLFFFSLCAGNLVDSILLRKGLSFPGDPLLPITRRKR